MYDILGSQYDYVYDYISTWIRELGAPHRRRYSLHEKALGQLSYHNASLAFGQDLSATVESEREGIEGAASRCVKGHAISARRTKSDKIRRPSLLLTLPFYYSWASRKCICI